MTVTLVGLVYYEDEGPDKPFRIVFPQQDDRELDWPLWAVLQDIHRFDPPLRGPMDERVGVTLAKFNPRVDPLMPGWVTAYTNPERKALMIKIPADQASSFSSLTGVV